MKAGQYIKFHRDVPEEEVKTKVFGVQYNTVEEHLMKGLRLMYPKIQLGWESDDFTKDLMTVVIEWRVFKVPRFLSRHLLSKKLK